MTAIARIEPHDGLPPQLIASEAEFAVLGAVLIGDPDTLGLMLQEVPDAAHFTDPRLAALYRVMQELAGLVVYGVLESADPHSDHGSEERHRDGDPQPERLDL